MNKNDATIPLLADLIVAALAGNQDATARAVDYVTSQLGIGEDDNASDVEGILRRALTVTR